MSFTNQNILVEIRSARMELERCKELVSNRNEIVDLIRELTLLENNITTGQPVSFNAGIPYQPGYFSPNATMNTSPFNVPPNSTNDFRARAIASNYSRDQVSLEARLRGLDQTAVDAAQKAIDDRDYFTVQEMVNKYTNPIRDIVDTTTMDDQSVMRAVERHLRTRMIDQRLIPEITRQITSKILSSR